MTSQQSTPPHAGMPHSVQTLIRQHTDGVWGGFVEIQGTTLIPIIGMSRNLLTDSVRYFGVVRYPLPSQTAYQLFYRSSGENTTVKGTWFPTDGLLAYGPERAGEPSGTNFAKLTLTQFSKKMLRYEEDAALLDLITNLGMILYPDTPIADRPRFVLNEFLRRFGTPRLIVVSYILGGGVWEQFSAITPILGAYLTSIGLPDNGLVDPSPRPQQIRIPTQSSQRSRQQTSLFRVSPLDDATTLNRFSRIAISTNFMKQEYRPQSVNHWVDYQDWYTRSIQIGSRSSTENRLKQLFGGRYRTPTIEPRIVHQGHVYIPHDLLHMNLDRVNGQFVSGIVQRVRKGFARSPMPDSPLSKKSRHDQGQRSARQAGQGQRSARQAGQGQESVAFSRA